VKAKAAWAIAVLIGAVLARDADADPYRLRADAYAYSQTPQSPVGMLVLQGDDKAQPWLDAEAMMWAGNGAGSADALVMMVRMHDPTNMGELRLGRQLLTAGAIRPLHLDGADARGRLPTNTTVELFGGVPVAPQLAYAAYDWASGGRVAQMLGRDTSMGASYVQQRRAGQLAYEEAGLDFTSSPTRWFDLATHGAYDLINPGLTEAGTSLASRFGDFRPELYGIHRSPSRLLPATSLFSALGDIPSDLVGASLSWRMFPRLDLLPMIGARAVGGDVGVDATLRTTLRLDDRGDGALSLEARRQGVSPDQWTGLRASARAPITNKLRWSTELELVLPDDPRGRGPAWPWGIVALRWLPAERWELAGAVESASTPKNAFELNAIMRLTWLWGAR
jgi:hypothetical protein